MIDDPEPSTVDVVIEYGAIEIDGRWYPSLWLAGRNNPSCTVCVGYEEAEAIERAKQEAEEEHAKFRGDWNITIRPREVPSIGTWRASQAVHPGNRGDDTGRGT